MYQSNVVSWAKDKSRSWAKDESGSLLSVAAFGIVAIAGFAILAVDVSYQMTVKNELQTAADASARAAVTQMPNLTTARLVGKALALKNLPVAKHGQVVQDGDVELGTWDPATKSFASGATPPNALRITAQRTAARGNPVSTFFANFVGKASTDLVVTAIAAPATSTPCVVALDKFELNSNSHVIADGCNLQVNSASSSALYLNSGSTVDVGSGGNVNVHGGVSGCCVTGGTTNTGTPTLPDPLASIAAPAEASDPCDYTSKVEANDGDTLEPRVYCKGIEVKGHANMNPGVYVIKGDKFIVNGPSASLTGTGVTIYLADKDALIEVNSGSVLNISAPTTGPMAGILISQDKTLPSMDHKFNSDATSLLEGIIHLPTGKFTVNSNSHVGGTTSVFFVIAREFDINSDSTLQLSSDFASSALSSPFPGSGIKLLN